MTLILDQGFQFRISNDLLVLPEETVSSDGTYQRNTSAPGIQLTPTFDINVNDVPWIGRPFFSAAYLMVDLDAGTWTLWQANATTDSRLISVNSSCDDTSKVKPSSTEVSKPSDAGTDEPKPNRTTDSASSAAPETDPLVTEHREEGLKHAAIAGIAVGAAAGSALLMGVVALYCWKKRWQRKRAPDGSNIALTAYDPGSEHSTPIWHEKSAASIQEMSALQIYSHELNAVERPSEAPGGPWDSRPIELPSANTPRA